ncbi:hypothetical protein [Thalassotalea euphylliae]|uniref:MSHA biogenesis protein MshI n=1 Tax=Thalassotalea euphylliae TaxID=1655234 RepID=A0A3E0U5I5_9GAMM|nr:hypothetical protein [Thalassotalea euphylliae]REL31813.1 hypothetical protein DXX94_14415 [Thalassotalea euphylliae]
MSLTSKFSKLFRGKKVAHQVGLAFRHDALAVCYATDQGDYHYHQFPVTNGDQLAALEQFASEGKLSAEGHLVLAPAQYQIVQVDKPNVPTDEILSALKWQIKDLVTIPPEEMILDYFSGPTLSGGAEKINVVVSTKSALQAIVEKMSGSIVELTTISTEEFAFASLVPFQEHAVLLVCQQPNEEVVILIVKHGRIFFHRRLRGYAQLASKTMEELSFGAIDSLSLEIQRSSDYFERQLKQAPIKEIQVILPIKTQNYIVTKLAENTNTPVNAFVFSEQHQDKAMYAAAIGASQLASSQTSSEEQVTHD